MGKLKVAIESGAGYTAGELIRILLNHPDVELAYIKSDSHNGQLISDVHKDLFGETDLRFGEIDFKQIDLVFLCHGHGNSFRFMKETTLPDRVKVIDLSTDFRDEHDNFIYGLPELNREKIRNCKRVANPGCFSTSIQLALLPLAHHELLCGDVHISSVTGSTGSGQANTNTTHFSWRNNNISAYKPLQHQHLEEINRSIKTKQCDFEGNINLLTFRGNFTRGIYTSLYTYSNLNIEELKQYYQEFYATHPFIRIVNELPDLKLVVNTNKCILYLERIGDKIFLVSVIDNLLKGASGQAVQNMNLMSGFHETSGLIMKSAGF